MSTTTSSWTLTCAQRFINNTSSPWFPVHDPTLIPSPRRDPWTLYEAQQREQVQTTTTITLSEDFRILQQFLLKHQWIEQIKGRRHDDLMPLVAYSTRDETYGTLHKDIHAFLAQAQASLDGYYIRRLVSIRPAEEHD
jgi:hypothetical protein